MFKLPPFSFVSLNHVCHHTQGWTTHNSLLLITFLWTDSQNSIIFIGSSHMWNVGQRCCQECSPSICDYNYDFLIWHFIIKCENITHQDMNVLVFKFSHTQTCVHMNSYGKGIIYPGSLDVEVTKSCKVWMRTACKSAPHINDIFYPHLINNENP